MRSALWEALLRLRKLTNSHGFLLQTSYSKTPQSPFKNSTPHLPNSPLLNSLSLPPQPFFIYALATPNLSAFPNSPLMAEFTSPFLRYVCSFLALSSILFPTVVLATISPSDLVQTECSLKVPFSQFSGSILSSMDVVQQVMAIFSPFGKLFGDSRLSTAISDCLDLLDSSTDQLSWSLSAAQNPNGTMLILFLITQNIILVSFWLFTFSTQNFNARKMQWEHFFFLSFLVQLSGHSFECLEVTTKY